MKFLKIFIIISFLFAFAFQVSAQDEKSKIVWKNLQEKYKSFYDIKPSVMNVSNQVIYIDSLYTHSISLLKYYEKYNEWIKNPIMICGTLSKTELKEIEKRKFGIQLGEEKQLSFNEDAWNIFIYGDGFLYPGFKTKATDNADGKYKFIIYYQFYTKNNKKEYSESFSPEFQVIEKQ